MMESHNKYLIKDLLITNFVSGWVGGSVTLQNHPPTFHTLPTRNTHVSKQGRKLVVLTQNELLFSSGSIKRLLLRPQHNLYKRFEVR